MEQIWLNFKKSYLHWKWNRRYLKAWAIACHKAYRAFGNAFIHREEIDRCSPNFYFANELKKLRQ